MVLPTTTTRYKLAPATINLEDIQPNACIAPVPLCTISSESHQHHTTDRLLTVTIVPKRRELSLMYLQGETITELKKRISEAVWNEHGLRLSVDGQRMYYLLGSLDGEHEATVDDYEYLERITILCPSS